MRKILEGHKKLSTVGILLIGMALFGVFVYADYRPGASTLLESTVASGVHTPVVATVPGVSASAQTSRFTSSTTALSYDTATSITTAFDLIEHRFTVSAASSTQTLHITLNSGAGSEFDVALLTQAMSTTSTVFRPTRPIPIRATDSITVIYGNVSGDTVGSELITTE